jgi:predicted aminopeptidase
VRITGKFPLLLAALSVLLCSCAEVAYYWQAAGGQLEILRKRRPIEDVLADPAVAAGVKAKLSLVVAAQAFAAEALALPRAGAYRHYADLGRPYVSWLVVAAPALEMREHQWCYPIAGCLGYRGYFERAQADALARELAAQGYDVAVRPVRAYSTLGWFDDPVLNTFLDGDEADLAGTLIHELSHRRLWVKGDTTFNESYAAFVEEEGVRRFLAARRGAGGEASWRRWLAARAEEERFTALVLQARARLIELYAGPLPEAEKLARKSALIEDLRTDYQKQRAAFRLMDYDAWFARPLNNAHLAGIAQYHGRVAAFRALFGQAGGDFARFHAAVEALGGLPAQERAARLDQLEAGHERNAARRHPAARPSGG